MSAKPVITNLKKQPQPLTGMDSLNLRMKVLGDLSLQEVSKDSGINRGKLHTIFDLETIPGGEQLPA
jgi:hypothetical protein